MSNQRVPHHQSSPSIPAPMDTAMDEAPASSPPPQDPPARLPRAGTFRQRRPISTGQGGLRRGTTFANRPQSFAASQSFKLPESDSTDPVPQLRRGSSFFSQPEQDDGHVVLRRAARRGSDADPPFRRSIRVNDTQTPPRPSLPRAGTFAFGTSLSSPQLDFSESVQTMPTPEKHGRGRQSCGMCSSCGTGSKAMPPWAPERMSRMTSEEREEVLREMHHKEEMGRLEAELRKKRVEEMQALSARLQVKHSLREDSDDDNANSIVGEVAKVDEEYALCDLESVDLGDEVQRKDTARNRRRRRSTSTTSRSTQDNMDDLVTRVDVAESVTTPRVVDSCGECDDLERKVKDLEEELAVLQEVVKICEENEAAERQEEAEDARRNHGKGWMGKIASAYYGSSAAANEKTRLKEEVEALRRATDFLFKKMQRSSR